MARSPSATSALPPNVQRSTVGENSHGDRILSVAFVGPFDSREEADKSNPESTIDSNETKPTKADYCRELA